MRGLAILIAVMLCSAPVVADQTNLRLSPVTAVAQDAGPVIDYLSELFPPSDAEQRAFSQIQTAACCKICRKGKACGNSCISRDKTCRKPPGCACDAQ